MTEISHPHTVIINRAGAVSAAVNALQEPRKDVRVVAHPLQSAFSSTIADLERRLTSAIAAVKEECVKIASASVIQRDGTFTIELKPAERGNYSVTFAPAPSTAPVPTVFYSVSVTSQNPDFTPPVCCLGEISRNGFNFIAHNVNMSTIVANVSYEVHVK